jgi:putative flippase GtrA
VNKIREVFEKYRKGIIQFIKFNFVGIINTVITFIVFYILHKLFNIHELIAEPIGYVCGLINSFILNKIWTFGKKYYFSPIEMIKFIMVNAVAEGGTLAIIAFAKNILHVDPLWGKIVSYFFSVPVNYLGFKYWVFKA